MIEKKPELGMVHSEEKTYSSPAFDAEQGSAKAVRRKQVFSLFQNGESVFSLLSSTTIQCPVSATTNEKLF